MADCTFSRHLLLRRWQTASFEQGWRFRADWFLPEVRTVVRSFATASTVPAPTAKSLGAARARNGVGISETMSDFRALFAAADRNLDIDALQSLAEGWAEGAETLPPISCTDVYTGLATQAHFQRHLHELSEASPGAAEAHAMAIIGLPGHLEGQGPAWTLLVKLGALVQSQLSGTGAMATYRSSAIHIVFQVCEANLSRLAECRAAVETLDGGGLAPVRMTLYPLGGDSDFSGRWPELP
ncbi:hypothetical protein ACIPY2_11130 [Paenarthrobacter sp. NPDC089675]|uniref:hypothetical protein n=1 Tax=Paenarthrobacter sp. NPDC089675 TaxID=3364376 RepID=UPI0037F44EDB